jgi:polysaccharide chain length determinant protein (PEP-CTERM system associated)
MPLAEADLSETLGNVLGIVTRQRRWIILPAAVTTLGTLIVLSLIPNHYSSEATLVVVQQQVPQRYVLPTSTMELTEALQAIRQEVLSRTQLLQIIDEFGLFAAERKRVSPEALLEKMRHDVKIEPVESQSSQRGVNSFKISFVADTPHLAQEVASKLTSLFIAQNQEAREHQAATTTNFLGEKLEAAKNKLAEAEEQVRRFKMQHLGELPEQEAGNLAILSGLQTQLQNTVAGLNRAGEQREALESLTGYRALTIESDLSRLQSEKAELLERYTPQYPAVKKISEKIARKEAVLKSLQGDQLPQGTKKPKGDGPQLSSMAVGEDPSLGQLRSQFEANRLEVENLSKDERRLNDVIRQYQNRLNATPVREQEIAGILRNYDILKLDYADLLNKEMQSQLAGDLEKRQEGQQFRLVDPPSLPTVPSSPNRIKISLSGVGAGIGLGLALAFLMNIRDRSFHSEEDLRKRFAFPLVVGVPLLLTCSDEQSRSWKRALEWTAGSALALAVLVVEFYEFYLYTHG